MPTLASGLIGSPSSHTGLQIYMGFRLYSSLEDSISSQSLSTKGTSDSPGVTSERWVTITNANL